ncbi:hypothetical protein Pelo_1434 [Pelomyxa schiedti]|nr:hypothetical protein Pelo_1434 [Pelomyxa schiedti]
MFCEVVICSVCKSENHERHKVWGIEKAAEKTKDELNSLQSVLTQRIAGLDNPLENFRATENLLEAENKAIAGVVLHQWNFSWILWSVRTWGSLQQKSTSTVSQTLAVPEILAMACLMFLPPHPGVFCSSS